MTDKKLYQELERDINGLRIFDTHEHLIYEPDRRLKNNDFFMFFRHYASTDLISSGLALKDLEKLRNPEISTEQKWKIFIPYWEFIKNTCYSKAVKIIAHDLFGFSEINLENVLKINNKLKNIEYNSYYELILKDKSKIDFILNAMPDTLTEQEVSFKEPDKDYFLPVICLDDLVSLNLSGQLIKLREENNIRLNSFSDYILFLDEKFEKRLGKIFAFKIGAAYSRELFFEDVSYHEAEKSFQKLLNLKKYDNFEEGITLAQTKPFQDYIYHYLIRKAEKNNLPVQIHTGILEGNANDISNSDPAKLLNIILKYRKTNFDLFHAGYPYTDKLISMIKMFPNCYFNMCWIPQISEGLYKRILRIVIELLPSNKVFGFGGDYMFVEGTYAAQKITKKAITDVLCEEIESGYFSYEDAIEYSSKILFTNPEKLYMQSG